MTLVAKVTMKKGWDSTAGLERGLAEMATDIHKRAIILAPKKDRHLVNSGRIKRLGSTAYQVSFGNSQVPYARIQELGGTIKPKRGRFLVFKNAAGETVFARSVTIKGKRYLTKAADGVARSDKGKYFKNKVG